MWSVDIPPTVYTFRDYLGAQTSTETFMYRLSENREGFLCLASTTIIRKWSDPYEIRTTLRNPIRSEVSGSFSCAYSETFK